MKKLMFLLIIILSGCRCIIGQIPPQYIYAGTDCTAPLPDYKTKLIVSDNCEIASVSQLPSPGYLLDASNKIVNVTLRAEDASGNFRQVIFPVALLDTIKPVITIDTSLISYQHNQMRELYDAADDIARTILDSTRFNTLPLINISKINSIGSRDREIVFADSVRVNKRLIYLSFN